MKTVIATPSAAGTATMSHVRSVAAASAALHAAGFLVGHANADGFDVVLNRNLLVNRALADPAMTHVLFLDTDIAVDRTVFDKLIARNAPFVAGIYPKRRLNLEAFAAQSRAGHDVPTALALALEWTVTLPRGPGRVEAGFMPIEGVGFGCVLIARETFERISAAGVGSLSPAQARLGGVSGQVLDFFGLLESSEGELLSEDLSFCKRARDADVELLGYGGPGIGHVGMFEYAAPFSARLRALANRS